MLAFWLARRSARHKHPHFECMATQRDERCEDGDAELDKPAIGHVCSCSCKRCSLIAAGPLGERVEICVCKGCDVLACGLHRSVLPADANGS